MPQLQELFQCDHPVALVTGSGAPRVGRAVAKRLAKLGCHIALHANASVEQANEVAEQIKRDAGTQAMVTTGSLAEDETAERIVAETTETFGRVDILVNSAAIWFPTKLEQVSADEVRKYLQINTVASLLCAKAAGLIMVDQPTGGSIINIGDWATTRPYLDHAAYFPSKGAVEAMTRSLAVELGSRNGKVRVNCIQPGPVLFADDVDEATRKKVATSTLTGRTGTPDHIAHAVEFLCENDFVTGVCLPVDGGRSVFAPDGLQVGMNLG